MNIVSCGASANYRVDANRSSERGAVLLEALFILPLVVWLALAALQIVWLFWAQQMLANTSHYVLRAGQLHHGDVKVMQRVLATGMAGTQLQTTGRAEVSPDTMRQDVWQATAQALLHGQLAARVQVLTPTAQQVQQYRERRYDLRSQQWVTEIPVDHSRVRLAEVRDSEAWLAARQLQLEIWWCLPLEVPWVGRVLQQAQRWNGQAAHQFCQLREGLIGKPLWPLRVRRQGPMLSGYRANH